MICKAEWQGKGKLPSSHSLPHSCNGQGWSGLNALLGDIIWVSLMISRDQAFVVFTEVLAGSRTSRTARVQTCTPCGMQLMWSETSFTATWRRFQTLFLNDKCLYVFVEYNVSLYIRIPCWMIKSIELPYFTSPSLLICLWCKHFRCFPIAALKSPTHYDYSLIRRLFFFG